MSELDLDALEHVADAATNLAPWEKTEGHYSTEVTSGSTVIAYAESGEEGEPMECDLQHIATFDPPTCKALIARVRLQEAIQRQSFEYQDQLKARVAELETRITDVADNLLGLQEVAPSIELLDRIETSCASSSAAQRVTQLYNAKVDQLEAKTAQVEAYRRAANSLHEALGCYWTSFGPDVDDDEAIDLLNIARTLDTEATVPEFCDGCRHSHSCCRRWNPGCEVCCNCGRTLKADTEAISKTEISEMEQ